MRWKLVVAAVSMIAFLIVAIGIGSTLINLDWPTNPGSWLRILGGSLLMLVSSIAATYVVPAVKAVIKDRGGARSEHADKYPGLRRFSQISSKRALLSVGITVALIYGSAQLPNIRPPSPPELEPGPIRVMSAIDESPRDPRFMLVQQWNNAHPDNPVELINVSGETDDQHTRMVRDAKTEHRADVYVLDVVWMREFIRMGYIQPIDESLLENYRGDDFIPNVWKTCQGSPDDGKGPWALPLNSDAGLLYYRSSPETAVPKSWNGYAGAAAKTVLITARNAPEAATGLQSANAAQLLREETLTVTALEAMWAAGSTVVNEQGSVIMNPNEDEVMFDGGAQTGLANLAAASNDPDIVLPGADKMDETTATQAFKDGHSLFMRNWPVAYDNLTDSGQDTVPFEVTALPHASVLGGQNLAIASTTEKPHAAQELMEFLTSPSSQTILFEVGGFAPTRTSAYVNSRRPYAQDLRTAVEHARTRPLLVHYTEFSVEFRNCVARALNAHGELEPDCARNLATIVKKG